MRERLGLYVARGHVRAAIVRGPAIVWHDELTIEPDESLGRAIAALLARAPRRRRRMALAGIALDGVSSQTKRLEGVPPTQSDDALRILLRENVNAFFVQTWRAAAIGTIERREDGACWATAFDASVAREIAAVVRPRFVARVAITTAFAALARLLPPGAHTLAFDGAPHRLIVADKERLARVTPAAGDPDAGQIALPAGLASLGHKALDFAPAYASALMAHERELAWREPSSRQRVASRIELALACCVFVVSGGWAVLAPMIHELSLLHSASRIPARQGKTELDAVRVAGELNQVSRRLAEIDRFQASRGAMTRLVGDITQSLPESTAVVNLHVDSLGGSLAVITLHAAAVLPQLGDVSGLVAPRLVGSISRERAANVQFERATIRFDRPHANRTARAAAPGNRAGAGAGR